MPRSLTAALAAVLVVTGLLTAGAAAAAPARDGLEGAQTEAARVAARVEELVPRAESALADWEAALGGLSVTVTTSISADAHADARAGVAVQERRTRAQAVRALYMSGGGVALYGTVLEARTPTELVQRTRWVQTVLSAGDVRHVEARSQAQTAAGEAAVLDQAALTQVVVVDEAMTAWTEVSALLEEAQRELDTATARVAQEQAVRDAAARLAAAQAAAEAAAASAPSQAQARLAPEAYKDLYVRAAQTCPGMSWTLLSAVGQVESGHGRNVGLSSAGARGPMQFMPATFAAYGVDGGGDGVVDILDPADSVFSAANYLCSGGAGEGSEGVRKALFRYNRAQWYVELVLSIVAQLEAQPETQPGAVAG